MTDGTQAEGQARIAAKIEHARQAETLLQRLGWSVAVLGIVGVATFSVLWAAGEISAEQGVSLILGTALAVVLSGAAAYGSGVNLGLGAERLELAARDAAAPTAPARAAASAAPAAQAGSAPDRDGDSSA